MKNAALHICYLSNEYPTGTFGGIGVFVQSFGRAMVERGHNVSVVGQLDSRGGRTDCGVTLHEVPSSRIPKLGVALSMYYARRELRRLHDAHPIDIIEASDWEGLFFGVHGVLPPSIPRVARLQGSQMFFADERNRKTGMISSVTESRSLMTADHIVGITRYVYDATCNLLPGIRKTRHSIIPNPVDLSAFHPRLNKKTQPGLVMFVGTLSEKKGIGKLAEAWGSIARNFPNSKLEFVGKDSLDTTSGRMWSEVLSQRLSHVPKDQWGWLGAIDHDKLPEVMARASICVFPSQVEPQGIVVCESMALGKPTIFTRSGPGEELLEHGRSGLLIDPTRTDEISYALIRLLRDEESRRYLGAEARNRAEELFGLTSIAKRYEGLYYSLIEEKSAHAL